MISFREQYYYESWILFMITFLIIKPYTTTFQRENRLQLGLKWQKLLSNSKVTMGQGWVQGQCQFKIWVEMDSSEHIWPLCITIHCVNETQDTDMLSIRSYVHTVSWKASSVGKKSNRRQSQCQFVVARRYCLIIPYIFNLQLDRL